MTPKEVDKLIKRVAALRRLAADNANEHEAASARAKANELEKTLPPEYQPANNNRRRIDPGMFNFSVGGRPASPTPRPPEPDWHAKREDYEPECGPNQWRTRNRMVVVNIDEVETERLKSFFVRASAKSQHKSRFLALRAEMAKRHTQQVLEDF